MGSSYVVSWVEGRLVYSAFGFEMSSNVQDFIEPSRQQWQGFWRSIANTGVWDWKGLYAPPDDILICDGTSWDIEIEYDGRAVRAEGENGYPGVDPGGSRIASLDPNPVFRRDLRAVSRLVGKRPFA